MHHFTSEWNVARMMKYLKARPLMYLKMRPVSVAVFTAALVRPPFVVPTVRSTHSITSQYGERYLTTKPAVDPRRVILWDDERGTRVRRHTVVFYT